MSTTTYTSGASSKSNSKELCCICKSQPYDLICTCGDKFDFNCIREHVENLGLVFQEEFQKASDRLEQVTILKSKENTGTGTTRALIEDWKRKRIQDINDIAEKALNDNERQENAFSDVASFQETYNQLSTEFNRIVHENLNNLIQLNRQMQDKIENFENVPEILNDDASLDALLRSKLNPSLLSNQNSTTFERESTRTSSSISRTELTREISRTESTIEREPTRSFSSIPRTELTREISRTEPTIEFTRTESTVEKDNSNEPRIDLTETNDTTNDYDYTNQDEFEAGLTRHIQRMNPIVIPINNDQYAATICCHNNQLLYNEYDRTTQSFRLSFIRDIKNPSAKQNITWNTTDLTINAADDEFIQDIVYSDKLSSYLVLNRARLRVYKPDTNKLDEYHTFDDRTMKRLACNDKYIYLTSTRNNSDEIILMNYNKEEEICKPYRDIIPTRVSRGAAQSIGEITDFAVGSNDQITIGYRLARRNEVGICVFNVANDGKEWSCVKQLLLNDCWHNDVSYTPRLDWCAKLNSFILIEYITGHLIMIDKDGQVQGECRFMHAANKRDSPINLTISTNDYLCIRYESSITIHKLTS